MSLLSHIGLLFLIVLHLVCIVLSQPVSPDIFRCREPSASMLNLPQTSTNCCVPTHPGIVDFVHPLPSLTTRVRRAAHQLDVRYISKFNEAVAKMKKMDAKHPWNFMQQANVHCAYCVGFYPQSGNNLTMQVHFNFLFFPYHRAYLYFFECILGKIIGDDTFALPFWNWDHPDGMEFPSAYTDPASSLYDPNRNHTRTSNLLDLDFINQGSQTWPREKQIESNLRNLHEQIVLRGNTSELFLGKSIRAGFIDDFGGPGTLESGAHASVHEWVGEDMSRFSTSGRDPIFFAHHANMDRIWELWKELPGDNRVNPNDTNWLDSSFIFWDENQKLVRIRVNDVLNLSDLGYTYQSVPVLWDNNTFSP